MFSFFVVHDWYLNLCRELFTFWLFFHLYYWFQKRMKLIFCGLIVSIVKIICTTCLYSHYIAPSSWILNKDKYGSIYHSQMTSANATKKQHIEIDYMNIKLWNIRSLQVLLPIFFFIRFLRIWKLIQNAVSLILTFLPESGNWPLLSFWLKCINMGETEINLLEL